MKKKQGNRKPDLRGPHRETATPGRAREQLNESVRLNSNSPEAHNNLGLVLLMQGDPERSIPEFSTALRLRPEFRLAQENLNRAHAQIKGII